MSQPLCLTCSKPFEIIKQHAGPKQKRFCTEACNTIWWNEQPLHPVIPRVDASHPRALELKQKRTQLVLLEAPTPWGPFSVFLRDDNWQYSDGSSGAYTPVLMPSWLDSKGVWMVSTQCCGTPQFAPNNHYSFNSQRLDWVVA